MCTVVRSRGTKAAWLCVCVSERKRLSVCFHFAPAAAADARCSNKLQLELRLLAAFFLFLSQLKLLSPSHWLTLSALLALVVAKRMPLVWLVARAHKSLCFLSAAAASGSRKRERERENMHTPMAQAHDTHTQVECTSKVR